ncbi:MAG: hypothetical protein ACD_79C01009G0001 [uncultured bacterium]|nr:MAG: hypothetical protein ACD_79C01009G0001 [uncultured bacterium]
MNSNELDKINKVFIEVLETMTFLFGDPVNRDEIENYPDDCIQAEMSFGGYRNGVIKMLVQTEMCVEIAANTLGKDYDETLKMVKATDAVKELLNIICGRVLTELFGEKPVFNLTPPEVTLTDESGWDDFKKIEDALFFQIDDWFVALHLIMK